MYIPSNCRAYQALSCLIIYNICEKPELYYQVVVLGAYATGFLF